MKRAFGKKELMAVVPVSMSTIDRMERNGEFPQRFWTLISVVHGTLKRLRTGLMNVRPPARQSSPEKSRRLISAFTAQ